MSHIHIPDGVIAPVWIVVGFIITAVLLGLAIHNIRKQDLSRKVPVIGVASALMIIAMSLPIHPFHINLAVLSGIIVGPWLGLIAVFIVNTILAFLGHGGITVIGLNTITLGSEVMVGSIIFYALSGRLRPVLASVAATVMALLVSVSLMIGIVGLTSAGWENALPHDHSAHMHEGTTDQHQHLGTDSAVSAVEGEHEEVEQTVKETKFLFFSGWIAVGLIVLIGIVIETVVTASIVSFLVKVRPDMINNSKIRVKK